jgi:phosphopantothenoylcysteine decarboxylase / phosphopantothenate---cysteine ligase
VTTTPWTGRRVLLGIGGGIAAYKLCEVASTLAQAGADVQVVLTASAAAFIQPLTFSTLCRRRAWTDADFWSAQQGRPLHIDLGEWAELMMIAPLTANTLGKLRFGLADNLLTNTVLASTAPVLLAPAMNTDMWEQSVVQENWLSLLQRSRFQGLEPESGRLACDRRGRGRLAGPPLLLTALESLLYSGGRQDWTGQRVLVSAGSTREYLDPVRFLGNPASGLMGVMLAQAARIRGATVTLVHGPLLNIEPALLGGLHCRSVETAQQMEATLLQVFPDHDWTFMAAAIADVRPTSRAAEKLPKAALPDCLPLTPVTDISAALGQQKRPNQRLIGFAAQTGEIVTPALIKLARKQLDAIVANPIDQPGCGFGSTTNRAVLLGSDGKRQDLPPCTKLALAHQLLDSLQAWFSA